MILSTKKYNREIGALRAAAAQETGLHPLRLAQLKQELLQRLPMDPPAAVSWRLVAHTRSQVPLFMRYVLPTVLSVSLVGGTVLASSSALPGSTLYPVKRLKERVELSLTVSAKVRAEVHADQARERLHELEQVQAVVVAEANTPAPAASTVALPVPALGEQRQPDPREAEARVEASSQVESALINLAQVRADLKAKGNLWAAGELGRNLKRLQAEAHNHRVEVFFKDEEDSSSSSGDTSGESTEGQTTAGGVAGASGTTGSEQGTGRGSRSNQPSSGSTGGSGDLSAPPSGAGSGIYGQVTWGPTCPVIQLGEGEDQCGDQPYQTTLVVKTQAGGSEVARVSSNSHGQFKLDLPPGSYLVVPLRPVGLPLGEAPAEQVTVTAQTYTKVHISYDTGIR